MTGRCDKEKAQDQPQTSRSTTHGHRTRLAASRNGARILVGAQDGRVLKNALVPFSPRKNLARRCFFYVALDALGDDGLRPVARESPPPHRCAIDFWAAPKIGSVSSVFSDAETMDGT